MNHKDFTTEVQKLCHIDHQQCATLLNALLKLMVQAAIDQIPVAIYGLGTFTSHKHPEYIQENPTTGEQTLFPPRISYRFHADNECVLTQEDNASLINQLSDYSHQSVATTASFLLNFSQTIKSHLQNHEEVEIHGLGQFHFIAVHQAELQRIAFTPDEQMRDQVNAPFNCFEPVIIREGITPRANNLDATETAEEALPIEDEQAIPIEDEQSIPIEDEQAMPTKDVHAKPTKDEQVLPAEVCEEPAEEESVTTDHFETTTDAPDSLTQETSEAACDVSETPVAVQLFYAASSVILLACFAFCAYLFWFDDEPVLLEAEVVSLDHKAKENIIVTDTIVDQDSVITIATPFDTTASMSKSIDAVTIQQPAAEPQERPKPEVNTKREFHRLIGADGQPVMVTLNPGERLTIVALNQFGDKAFWPYVFDANADRLKAPNLVQAGMKLYLPDPVFYGIDANSEESLRKAKNRGAQLLK